MPTQGVAERKIKGRRIVAPCDIRHTAALLQTNGCCRATRQAAVANVIGSEASRSLWVFGPATDRRTLRVVRG
jgi:hypothetical protein